MSEDITFEEQLRLEALEEEQKVNKKTRIDEDGTEYEWDEKKRAWFPKIDNDFIANYQMNYGSASSTANDSAETEAYKQQCLDYWRNYYKEQEEANGDEDSEKKAVDEAQLQALADYYSSPAYREWYAQAYGAATAETAASAEDGDTKKEEETEKEKAEAKQEKNEEDDGKEKKEQENKEGEKKGKKRKREPPKWFEMNDDKNLHVYVQNIPKDTTDEEFRELMNKVGLIMFDPITRKPKLKLYRDEKGELKGDGRCCYIKPESIDLALQILDGYNFKGNILSVQRAQFQMKGDFNPTMRRKLTKQEKKKAKLHQEKLFAWAPDKNKFIRSNRERVLILKKVFQLSDFEDALYIDVLRDRVRTECSKFGGVKKINIYDHNPEGVVRVLFSQPEEVDQAVPQLNGRIFGPKGRVITAEVWDGRARFDVKESADSQAKRDEAWETFLTGKEEKEGGRKEKEGGAAGDKAEERKKEMEEEEEEVESEEEKMEDEESEEEKMEDEESEEEEEADPGEEKRDEGIDAVD